MNEEVLRFLDREQLVLSSHVKRFGAFAIDELILSILWLSVIWDSFSGLEALEDQINLINAYILEFMLLKTIYHTFFVWQYGASPGKMLLKIRVIALREEIQPDFFCALNRASFRILSEMLVYIGFVWGLLDPLRQTWHDKTAKTVVIDA